MKPQNQSRSFRFTHFFSSDSLIINKFLFIFCILFLVYSCNKEKVKPSVSQKIKVSFLSNSSTDSLVIMKIIPIIGNIKIAERKIDCSSSVLEIGEKYRFYKIINGEYLPNSYKFSFYDTLYNQEGPGNYINVNGIYCNGSKYTVFMDFH